MPNGILRNLENLKEDFKCRIWNTKASKKSLEESEFVNGFKTVFKNKYDYKKIWALTLEACKQRKGTMLIITEEAESEANRLCNQCFKIDYSPESQNFKELIKYITSIDGGVLLHPNGKCYAIGTILDGKSVNTLGDITRGARYNSALRYINDSSSENCLIIIVSEDGMISLKHSKTFTRTNYSHKSFLFYTSLLSNCLSRERRL